MGDSLDFGELDLSAHTLTRSELFRLRGLDEHGRRLDDDDDQEEDDHDG